jgi:hypothetical protein
MGEEVLFGSYRSDPFSAAFRVSNSQRGCRGSYNALQGSIDATFDVICSNGQRGEADIVLDRDGRSGIGGVYMDDGTPGRIVFGRRVDGCSMSGPVNGSR